MCAGICAGWSLYASSRATTTGGVNMADRARVWDQLPHTQPDRSHQQERERSSNLLMIPVRTCVRCAARQAAGEASRYCRRPTDVAHTMFTSGDTI